MTPERQPPASRPFPPTGTRRVPFRRWSWGIGLLLVVAAVAVWRGYRNAPPLPPPPVVNTAGFDPAIATAIAQARQTLESAPRSAVARGQMGMVLLAHDIRPQAADCFAQAAALDPREPRWPYLRGLAQLADNPTAAATNFEHAVRLFPESEVAPRLRLGDTLLTLGRLDEAEAGYRGVLKIQPKSALAQLGLAKVANARGLPTQAAEFLSAAREDPGTRKTAQRLLLTVYQRLGRTNETEQLSRALAALPPDAPFPDPFLAEVQQLKTGEAAWIELGEEWIKAGRLPEAAKLLEQTVESYPASDRAMFLLGRARLRLGDAAGAEAMLMRAVAVAPGSIEAQMQLGVTQLRRGRTKEAQACFRAALQAKPTLAEGWYNLGLSLGEEPGKRQESMAAFREAIRLKPDLIEAYLALAVVLRAEGKRQEAAEQLKQALAFHPEEPLRQQVLKQLKLNE